MKISDKQLIENICLLKCSLCGAIDGVSIDGIKVASKLDDEMISIAKIDEKYICKRCSDFEVFKGEGKKEKKYDFLGVLTQKYLHTLSKKAFIYLQDIFEDANFISEAKAYDDWVFIYAVASEVEERYEQVMEKLNSVVEEDILTIEEGWGVWGERNIFEKKNRINEIKSCWKKIKNMLTDMKKDLDVLEKHMKPKLRVISKRASADKLSLIYITAPNEDDGELYFIDGDTHTDWLHEKFPLDKYEILEPYDTDIRPFDKVAYALRGAFYSVDDLIQMNPRLVSHIDRLINEEGTVFVFEKLFPPFDKMEERIFDEIEKHDKRVDRNKILRDPVATQTKFIIRKKNLNKKSMISKRSSEQSIDTIRAAFIVIKDKKTNKKIIKYIGPQEHFYWLQDNFPDCSIRMRMPKNRNVRFFVDGFVGLNMSYDFIRTNSYYSVMPFYSGLLDKRLFPGESILFVSTNIIKDIYPAIEEAANVLGIPKELIVGDESPEFPSNYFIIGSEFVDDEECNKIAEKMFNKEKQYPIDQEFNNWFPRLIRKRNISKRANVSFNTLDDTFSFAYVRSRMDGHKLYFLGGMWHGQFLEKKFPEYKVEKILHITEKSQPPHLFNDEIHVYAWRAYSTKGPMTWDENILYCDPFLPPFSGKNKEKMIKDLGPKFDRKQIKVAPNAKSIGLYILKPKHKTWNAGSKAISKRASEYEKKRKFDKTPEPKSKKKPKKNQHRYVIQRHKAEGRAGEHFDLRLENDKGTMSSWAIPKHRLPKRNEILLAKKTEDHPIEYNKFEGIIPKGEYGAGTVSIEFGGTYEEIEWKSDKIKFKIKQGIFVLFKTDGDNWMIKEYKGGSKENEDETE